MSKEQLTARRLRELLRYDAKTQIWRWRTARPGRNGRPIAANEIAAPNSHGIQLDGRMYAKSTLVRYYDAADETLVTVVRKCGHGGGIKFRQDNREAAEDEPAPVPKPRKPILKASPRAVAERLRTLRVPEHMIARHVEGLRQAADASQHRRSSTHTEQDEDHDGL